MHACHEITNNTLENSLTELVCFAAGYNTWREWCGLKRANNFDTLTDIPDPDVRNKFRSIYRLAPSTGGIYVTYIAVITVTNNNLC